MHEGVHTVIPATGQKEHVLSKTASTSCLSGQRESAAMKDYTTTVTILESMSDGVFILNPEGRIEYANNSALGFLNMPLEDVVGASIDSFLGTISGSRREGGSQSVLDDLSDGDPDRTEVELLGRLGPMPALLNLGTIPGADGEADYFILTIKELAYHKALERERHLQRSQGVSHDRLRILGEISVGLVHEMGQPVAALQLLLETLQRQLAAGEADPRDLQRRTDMLAEEIQRLGSIVGRARQFAQDHDGLTPQRLDVNGVVESAIKLLEYELKKADIDWQFKGSEQPLIVLAHRPSLEQVIMNLVTNAQDAYVASNRSADQRVIRIRTTSIQDKWVEIQICDQAVDIESDVSRRMFEPFFSTRNPAEHPGTGLSVARDIIRSLGGDIRFQAEPDGGSCFRILIPLEAEGERQQLFNLIELHHQQ